MKAERTVDTYDSWRENALIDMVEAFGDGIEPWFSHMEKDLRFISHPMGEREFVNVINGLLDVYNESVKNK